MLAELVVEDLIKIDRCTTHISRMATKMGQEWDRSSINNRINNTLCNSNSISKIYTTLTLKIVIKLTGDNNNKIWTITRILYLLRKQELLLEVPDEFIQDSLIKVLIQHKSATKTIITSEEEAQALLALQLTEWDKSTKTTCFLKIKLLQLIQTLTKDH